MPPDNSRANSPLSEATVDIQSTRIGLNSSPPPPSLSPLSRRPPSPARSRFSTSQRDWRELREVQAALSDGDALEGSPAAERFPQPPLPALAVPATAPTTLHTGAGPLLGISPSATGTVSPSILSALNSLEHPSGQDVDILRLADTLTAHARRPEETEADADAEAEAEAGDQDSAFGEGEIGVRIAEAQSAPAHGVAVPMSGLTRHDHGGRESRDLNDYDFHLVPSAHEYVRAMERQQRERDTTSGSPGQLGSAASPARLPERLNQRDRLRRVMMRLSQGHPDRRESSGGSARGESGAYGDRVPRRNNLFDWSPAADGDAMDIDADDGSPGAEEELEDLLVEIREDQRRRDAHEWSESQTQSRQQHSLRSISQAHSTLQDAGVNLDPQMLIWAQQFSHSQEGLAPSSPPTLSRASESSLRETAIMQNANAAAALPPPPALPPPGSNRRHNPVSVRRRDRNYFPTYHRESSSHRDRTYSPPSRSTPQSHLEQRHAALQRLVTRRASLERERSTARDEDRRRAIVQQQQQEQQLRREEDRETERISMLRERQRELERESERERYRSHGLLRDRDRDRDRERERERERERATVLDRIDSFRRNYGSYLRRDLPRGAPNWSLRGRREEDEEDDGEKWVPSLEQTIAYLDVLRYSESVEESRGFALRGEILAPEILEAGGQLVDETTAVDDFLWDVGDIPEVQKTSWLEPGAVLEGVQYATSPTGAVIMGDGRSVVFGANAVPSAMDDASLAQILASGGAGDMGRAGWGGLGSGPQQDRWPVKVTIHAVDWENMSLSATMEAYNVPSHPHPHSSHSHHPGSLGGSSSAAQPHGSGMGIYSGLQLPSISSLGLPSSATSYNSFSNAAGEMLDATYAHSGAGAGGAGGMDGSGPQFTRTSSITTFLEGEILDFREHHSLCTRSFKSTLDNDATYWAKLPCFEGLDDEELARRLTSRTWWQGEREKQKKNKKMGGGGGGLLGDWVLMRWKERCFVGGVSVANPTQGASGSTGEQRGATSGAQGSSGGAARSGAPGLRGDQHITTFDDSSCGLTISGFYYVCLNRRDGRVTGLYCDPASSPYQCLKLESVNARSGTLGSWAFR